MMKVNRLNDKQKELVSKLDFASVPVQAELDALDKEFQAAMAVVNEIKSRIRPMKAKLEPFSEMKAGVCNIHARNKYFPKFLGRFDDEGKLEAFYSFVESKLV